MPPVAPPAPLISPPTVTPPGTMDAAIPAAQSLLNNLLATHVLLPEEWEEMAPDDRDELSRIIAPEVLLGRLVMRHLLTRYQADMIRKGHADDLVISHYRLLDVLGQGGMGTVYRAEHIELRREVAIKIMGRTADTNARLLHRFYAEARAVARLQHPHIVACFDAGRYRSTGPGTAWRDYFVMELIPGQDLFALIRDKGPISPTRACDLFRQVAEALGEAHRHGLIHRDIKPSNILVTPDGQAKVLDFGLARLPTRHMTEPGTLLGTIGYMAPEQARDPHGVDTRADLFGLGASMYWALTGREPYPETGNPIQDLHRRFTTTPPPVRRVRPEVPVELSDLVGKLMEADPDMRFPSARTVSAALSGFSLWIPNEPQSADRPLGNRVLLVEDDPGTRALMVALLRDQCDVTEAEDGETALAALTSDPPDLAVIDVTLPGLTGPELVGKARAAGIDMARMSVLITSGDLPQEALGGLAVTGANDFISKPFRPAEFQSRVRTLLLRHASKSVESTETRNRHIATPAALTPVVRAAVPAEALSMTVSRLLGETQLIADGHWCRLLRYVRALTAAAPSDGEYSRLKDSGYVNLLAAVAPLYDIGQLGVPRQLLMKPDRLDADERSVLQTHTTLGAEVLHSVAQVYGGDVPGLDLAAEIARSHHERWDGGGYPDGLVGEQIPLSARVVAIVAVYEALRTRRPHRPQLSHARAVKMIASEMPGQFDPHLLAAFVAASPRFDQIHSGE